MNETRPTQLRSVDTLTVVGPASAPGFDFDTFETAWSAFEEART